jgi:hypothetical protein
VTEFQQPQQLHNLLSLIFQASPSPLTGPREIEMVSIEIVEMAMVMECPTQVLEVLMTLIQDVLKKLHSKVAVGEVAY